MDKDFVAIPGNCLAGYRRHYFLESRKCYRCGKYKPRRDELYCHVCGYKHIIHESPAEGYWCPNCGSSDSDGD